MLGLFLNILEYGIVLWMKTKEMSKIFNVFHTKFFPIKPEHKIYCTNYEFWEWCTASAYVNLNHSCFFRHHIRSHHFEHHLSGWPVSFARLVPKFTCANFWPNNIPFRHFIHQIRLVQCKIKSDTSEVKHSGLMSYRIGNNFAFSIFQLSKQ